MTIDIGVVALGAGSGRMPGKVDDEHAIAGPGVGSHGSGIGGTGTYLEAGCREWRDTGSPNEPLPAVPTVR